MHISSKAGKAKYNPETFVIEQEDSHVAENLIILSEHELQNPHIKFFMERNPGWRKAQIAGKFFKGGNLQTLLLKLCRILFIGEN